MPEFYGRKYEDVAVNVRIPDHPNLFTDDPLSCDHMDRNEQFSCQRITMLQTALDRISLLVEMTGTDYPEIEMEFSLDDAELVADTLKSLASSLKW